MISSWGGPENVFLLYSSCADPESFVRGGPNYFDKSFTFLSL